MCQRMPLSEGRVLSMTMKMKFLYKKIIMRIFFRINKNIKRIILYWFDFYSPEVSQKAVTYLDFTLRRYLDFNIFSGK